MNLALPFLSSLVSLVFALAVLDQFFGRRKPYQLVWALGLLFYFAGTGSEFLHGAFGPNVWVYRLWYLSGPVLVAAYLGMGTIYLLAPRRLSHGIMTLLLLATVFAAYQVFTTFVDPGIVARHAILTGDAFVDGPMGPRFWSRFLSIAGALALVGGSLYSAWVFWRHRIMAHRVVSNLLIAFGAFLPALAGVVSRLGVPDLRYIMELMGVIVIFLGFLRSQEVFGLYRFPFIHGMGRVEK
ncbi:MAG: hypothetical protein Q8O76_08285 [Chloroflexota bacterium]|nr:hypothetical protein [Chloroflexota bacterium]